MVGQVPCKCEGLASGRRAQGLRTHKSGQGVGRPAAGRTHPARQRLLQGGGQGRPHPHIQGPRSGPSPRRHPPEGTPGRGRAVGRRPSLRRPVLGAAGPRVRGTRYAQRLPCCRARETHAACRPRRMPSGPPWRNGGGLGAGVSLGTSSFRDTPLAHRGPRASPAGAALAGAERPARAAPDTPTPLHEQPPNAAAQTRSRLEAHAAPGPDPPQASGWSPGPATPWGGRISQEKRLIL